MRFGWKNGSAALAFVAGALAAGVAPAANLFWFGDGTNLGGSGTWSAAGTNWSTSAVATTSSTWNAAFTANFRGPAGTVTVDPAGIPAAAGMTFETGPYTLTGTGVLTLTGASVVNNVIDVFGGVTANANAVIAGTTGLTKAGTGTLVLGAANTYTGETFVNGGTLTVSGAGRIASGANMQVGFNTGSNNNSLKVTAGGVVTSSNGYLGADALSGGNAATIDSASSWTTPGDLVIGYAGKTNTLTVNAGGTAGAKVGYVGFAATATGNAVVVAGANAKWSTTDVLYVGFDGASNSFTVDTGGLATSGADTVVGFHAGSTSNLLKVTGAGTKFQVLNGKTMIVGESGSGTLEISGGAVVSGKNARVGRLAGSGNNVVTVKDPASAWNSTGTLRFGDVGGGGNTMTVSGGATVSFGGNAVIGFGAAGNNAITVTGTNSSWTNDPATVFTVGRTSTGNALTVSAGASVTAPLFLIAELGGSGGTFNVGAGAAAGSVSGPVAFGLGTAVLNFNHTDAAYTFANVIADASGGSGAVTLQGSGTTILAAANTYSGGTNLDAGTLRLGVNNALPGTGAVSFNGGTIAANDRSASAGTLLLKANSTLAFGTTGTREDLVFASAAPYVGGTLTIKDWGGESAPIYDHLIITADPSASGILAHIQFQGYPLGAKWVAATGEVRPTISLLPGPVPTLSQFALVALLLLLAALGGLGVRRASPRQRGR